MEHQMTDINVEKNKDHFRKFDEKQINGDNEKNNTSSPADFEAAISATGFGKFNIVLFIIALPSCWASEFDFTTTSYILPAAQCDLELTLVHKGWLNAIAYLGTVSSAFLWGFLADTLGRRKLLIFGYCVDAVFVLLSTLSQNFWTFLIIKFINGFIIGGPYAIFMSYISEFHSANYRAPILILSGMFFSLANMTLSGLAWWIIPNRNLATTLFNGAINFNSWQVFLLVCAIPSMVSGICTWLLPESPKFLMTAGRNDEAMEVFQTVYSINTGKPRECYPIKSLVDERAEDKSTVDNEIGESGKQPGNVRSGWKQIRPIFSPPYLTRIVYIYTILFMGLLGENTLRLWLPQLFTKIDEYSQLHNYTSSASLCEMLDVSPQVEIINGTISVIQQTCSVIEVDKQVYINTMVVATSNLVFFIIVSSLVNKVGKKWLLILMYFMCAASGVGNYWSTGATITLFLVSIHGGVASICTSTMISVIVDLFPTTLRTMTISLGMMFGRMGSILGNVIFPILLEIGCLPPFLLIGGTALGCTILSLLLPNIKMKSLD